MVTEAEIMTRIGTAHRTGFNEATRRIRALENKELANIPIIAMTANAFEEDRQNALAAGMNAHLIKPIDTMKLRETLAEFAK